MKKPKQTARLIFLFFIFLALSWILHFTLNPKTIYIENEIKAEEPKEEEITFRWETSNVIDLTEEETIEDKIKSAFGEDGNLAIAIAKAESQLNPTVEGDKHLIFYHNGEKLGSSLGLFQIRTGGKDKIVWSRPKQLGITSQEFEEKLKDPEYNINYAKEIYERTRKRGGRGFEPWSTFTNGEYKKYL